MDALHPWVEDLPPFQLYGKLWHVGGKSSPSYLFDTGDGLLLLDTGFPKTGYFLFRNIYDLGFNPKNIRWILHSHGHFDHFGCTRAIAEMTGAKTYIGAPDGDIAAGRVDLSWAKELGTRYDEPFEPDVLINDGDVLHFGNLAVRCVAAPGHTAGTMAFFFDLEEDGVVRHAGMHGGVGFKAMSLKFLKDYGLPTDCRQKFLDGLEKLKSEPVEVMVGNHLGNNKSLEKVARRKADPAGPNPFVDSAEWVRFLTKKAAEFRAFLQQDTL